MSSAGPRSAIIGSGFMGEVHARAIRAAGGSIVAVASRNVRGASALAARHGAPRVLADASELVAAEDVDIVHICTPNATHAEYAEAAISAGKHVVCEKPLATSESAARSLSARAAAAGLVAAVPFVYRYHPMVMEMRSLIRAGDLGRLLNVQGSYLQDWLLDPADDDWRVSAADGGASRAFADIGSHLVDLIEFVSGERIVAVSAATQIAHPVRGAAPVSTEDAVALIVKLSAGALGSLLIAQTAAGHDNDLRIELMGTSSSVAFEQERPDRVRIGRRGRTTILHRGAVDNHRDSRELSLVPSGHPMGYQDAFTAFIRDVHAAVAGEPPERLPTFDAGARAAALTERVIQSARQADWVQTEEHA